MSLTLNMVGGGGGGLSSTDALLRVQAPAGSTVTITKGSTTKTDQGHENADDNTVYDYYFIIHQSQFDSTTPWTVTATLGDKSATKTVTINAASEYDLSLRYRLYLYNRGVIETDITGGLSNSGYVYDGQSLAAATFNTDNIYFSSSVPRGVGTVNNIDLTEYRTLYFCGKAGTSNTRHPWVQVTQWKSFRTSTSAVFLSIGSNTETTVSVDISSLSGGYYIVMANSSEDANGYCYELYLER